MILFGNEREAVATLLEDDAGELAAWLRRYLPVAVADMFVRPPAHRELALSVADGRVLAVPTPNWPPMPEVRFNRLYWPTGATRWSHCFLLATTAQKDKLYGLAGTFEGTAKKGMLTIAPNGWKGRPGDTGQTLDDNGVVGIGAEMYVLPARRVVCEYLESGSLGDSASAGLWIVPLVDQRYFWQTRHVPALYDPSDWTAAFTDILTELGATYDEDDIEDFDADYGEPDLSYLEFHNAAMVLDGLAFTIGRRIVADLDGTVLLQTADQAETAIEGNVDTTANGYQRIAGGDDDVQDVLVPETLTLVFPEGEEVEEATDHDLTATEIAPDLTYAIHVAKDGDDNAAYTAAFAADWYAWLTRRYHETYVGLKKWEPCGYDDAIEWCLGSRVDGELQAITRVKSLPFNWGMTTLLRLGTSETTTDDRFPPGSPEACFTPCMSNCIAGTTLADAGGLECCESHLRWSLKNPWLTCEDTDLTLEYIGSHVWLTEEFDGPDCGGNQNVYQFKLTIDVDGSSYLTLVLVTDNGCADVCLVYGKSGFNCLCVNTFMVEKPLGRFGGIELSEISCSACIVPDAVFTTESCTTEGPLPLAYEVTFGTACSPFSTTENVGHYDGHGDPKFGSTDTNNYAGCVAFYGRGCLWYTIGTNTGNEFAPNVPALVFRRETAGRWTLTLLRTLISGGATTCVQEAVWTSATDFDPLVGGTLTLTTDTGTACCTNNSTVTIAPIDGEQSPDSTGACADASCTDTTAPTDPDGGACCLDGHCFDYYDETLCDSFGGTWFASEATCDDECSPSGACCYNNDCYDIMEYECGLLGGAFIQAGQCPAACGTVGSCCRAATATCEVVNSAFCSEPDYYAGDGTNCTSDPCPSTGACCSMDQDGHTCLCDDDYTYTQCQEATGGAGQWAPGQTCTEVEATAGVCGEDVGGDCGWGF